MSSASSSPAVGAVLLDLARHPIRSFVAGWNWKSAAVSALYRAVIFFITTFRAGWKAALAALTLEAAFRVVSSGFYGVVAQALRNARPAWLSALVVMLVLPAIIQIAEAWVHWRAGTPHFWRGVIVSTIAAGLSALFTWFAMKRGAFIVGEGASSFWQDMRRYPALLGEFLWAGPKWLILMARGPRS
jgi:hypothetical protein